MYEVVSFPLRSHICERIWEKGRIMQIMQIELLVWLECAV